jgi:hypothetical protein
MVLLPSRHPTPARSPASERPIRPPCAHAGTAAGHSPPRYSRPLPPGAAPSSPPHDIQEKQRAGRSIHPALAGSVTLGASRCLYTFKCIVKNMRCVADCRGGANYSRHPIDAGLAASARHILTTRTLARAAGGWPAAASDFSAHPTCSCFRLSTLASFCHCRCLNFWLTHSLQ